MKYYLRISDILGQEKYLLLSLLRPWKVHIHVFCMLLRIQVTLLTKYHFACIEFLPGEFYGLICGLLCLMQLQLDMRLLNFNQGSCFSPPCAEKFTIALCIQNTQKKLFYLHVPCTGMELLHYAMTSSLKI